MLELHINPEVLDQITDVTLDEIDYKYRLYWNSMYNRWYMDWFDASSNPLMTGVKVVVGQPLIKSRLFKGTVVVLNSSDDDSPPSLTEMGRRVKMYYLNRGEYPSQVLRRPLDDLRFNSIEFIDPFEQKIPVTPI